MEANNAISSKQQKFLLSEKLWLSYFNNYLYEKGMLTETERNRMIAKIENRKGSTSSTRRKTSTE